MIYNKEIVIWTKTYNAMVPLVPEILHCVEESGVKNGLLTVISLHTTTGIMVNEGLECLEKDIEEFLARLAPEDYPYNHARMLKSYGSTAGNPTGHLKSHLTGNHCHIIVSNGILQRGDAQEVFLCEFDGPAKRRVLLSLAGE